MHGFVRSGSGEGGAVACGEVPAWAKAGVLMANHPAPDPVEEKLALNALAENARAIGHAEGRVKRLKDARALLFLAGSGRDVTVPAMAGAAGVSKGLAQAELVRARTMPTDEVALDK